MLVNSENKPRYTDLKIIEQLKEQRKRSWLKKDNGNAHSASVAITNTEKYFSGIMESRTHLLDFSSEHIVLALSAACKDPHVKEVITLTKEPFLPNPLVIKILIDHVKRTGTLLKYSVINEEGSILFSLSDILSTYYQPKLEILDRIHHWEKTSNVLIYDSTKSFEEQLYNAAKKGMEVHFTSQDSSHYGASVLAGGKIYYAGVYPAMDKRLGIHSEMLAALAAIADGNRNITHVGIISNKFTTKTNQMCGCCRQFFAEIQEKVGHTLEIWCFSFDGLKKEKFILQDYLPHAWSSETK